MYEKEEEYPSDKARPDIAVDDAAILPAAARAAPAHDGVGLLHSD